MSKKSKQADKTGQVSPCFYPPEEGSAKQPRPNEKSDSEERDFDWCPGW